MTILETIDIQQTPKQLNPNIVLNSELSLVTLNAGNKTLQLKFHLRAQLFSTFIVNNNRTPVEGATTSLYKRAYGIMYESAFIMGHSIRYMFESENQAMIGWAQNKGQAVFNWDSIWTNDSKLLAIKEIIP